MKSLKERIVAKQDEVLKSFFRGYAFFITVDLLGILFLQKWVPMIVFIGLNIGIIGMTVLCAIAFARLVEAGWDLEEHIALHEG